MARWFSCPAAEYRLLDPGAGVGSLTAAVCEEFCTLTSPRRLEIHLFENDPKLIDLLTQNMTHCRSRLESVGHTLRYYVHVEDFVVAASRQFSGGRTLFREEDNLGQFDGVITNPPYFKIGKDSKHARIMADIVHGQPNIYALFLALSAHLLRVGGELVAITPRSFCNGLYFRDFRKWFLERMSLERIHLFESRTETFKDAGVLQESIIWLSRRRSRQSPTMEITTSLGCDFQEGLYSCRLAAEKVIDRSGMDCVIRIPTSGDNVRIMEVVEALPLRFSETGLRISTGPVVMFRATDFLLENINGRDAVPLLLPHNVKAFETVWPVKKNKKPVAFRICAESRRLSLPVRNYVLLKRFSAKEERRRLIAGCYLRARQKAAMVALENHLNYVYHHERDLTEEETYGIAAVFNSLLFDRYFRMISGNTQVNATELRNMNFPDLSVIAEIGRRVKELPSLDAKHVENIVLEELGVPSSLRTALLESSE